jgi:hypothetical protein
LVQGASVKGAVLDPAFSRVKQYVRGGKLGGYDLSRHLNPGDVDLLAFEVHPTLWYPIELCDRLIHVVCDCDGAGDEGFYASFGAREAEVVLSSRPLRALVDGASVFGNRSGVALVKLANFAFSFGKWRYTGGSLADFRVEATDVGPLPDTLRYVLEGFMSSLASRLTGELITVTSVRPTRDWITFAGSVG